MEIETIGDGQLTQEIPGNGVLPPDSVEEESAAFAVTPTPHEQTTAAKISQQAEVSVAAVQNNSAHQAGNLEADQLPAAPLNEDSLARAETDAAGTPVVQAAARQSKERSDEGLTVTPIFQKLARAKRAVRYHFTKVRVLPALL